MLEFTEQEISSITDKELGEKMALALDMSGNKVAAIKQTKNGEFLLRRATQFLLK